MAATRRDHLLGDAPAAVAVADRQQALGVRLAPARPGPRLVGGLRPDAAVVAAVRVVEHVGEHAAAVEPLPPEQVVREPVGLRPRQLDREEPLDAGAAQQLRQRGREAEAVGQPADGVRRAEALREVALAVEQLAHERLAGRHHAVGLDPHAADRLEAALGGERLDAPEQLGVVALQPREQLRGRLVEVQLGVALEQADRRPQRAPRLAPRLGQRPAPRQVEVRVCGQCQRAGGRVALGDAPELPVEALGDRADRAADIVVEPGRARVEPGGQLPDVLELLAAGAAGDVRQRGARPVELAQRLRRGVDQRAGRVVARAERVAGLEHQLEPAEQRLEHDVDPHDAGDRQPRVAVGHPERQPRDRLGADGERRAVERELAVLGVRAVGHRRCPPRERDQRLAAEIEPQPRVRPRDVHLRVLEAVHARAVRPRRAERVLSAVERPVVEVEPLAVPPRAQLVDPDREPLQPLLHAARHRARVYQARACVLLLVWSSRSRCDASTAACSAA